MAITVEKLKENFAQNGQTLAQWARENGFNGINIGKHIHDGDSGGQTGGPKNH